MLDGAGGAPIIMLICVQHLSSRFHCGHEHPACSYRHSARKTHTGTGLFRTEQLLSHQPVDIQFKHQLFGGRSCFPCCRNLYRLRICVNDPQVFNVRNTVAIKRIVGNFEHSAFINNGLFVRIML
jgi:hypothetical protein